MGARHHLALVALASAMLFGAACGSSAESPSVSGGSSDEVRPLPSPENIGDTPTTSAATPPATTTPGTAGPEPTVASPIPGDRQVIEPEDVYSQATAERPSPAVAGVPAYVYVPTYDAATVLVIDQETFEVVAMYPIGGSLIERVVPSLDLSVLYATASDTNRLVPFDPTTGEPTGEELTIEAPYNVYFTPGGRRAVVIAKSLDRIDYYHPAMWAPMGSVTTPCDGPSHAAWSADGSFFVVTCEFSGDIIRLDTMTGEVLDVIALGDDAEPQDVRLGPDGSTFYVADLAAGAIVLLDAETLEITGSIATGAGAHSISPSRDGMLLYVANRDAGTVSIVDPSINVVIDEWAIPGGGSPDMGGVSADGSTLWLSGRGHEEVYAFDTATGELKARIAVPGEPGGLAVFPQPDH